MSACDRCKGTGTIEVYMRGGKKREFPCPDISHDQPTPPKRPVSP